MLSLGFAGSFFLYPEGVRPSYVHIEQMQASLGVAVVNVSMDANRALKRQAIAPLGKLFEPPYEELPVVSLVSQEKISSFSQKYRKADEYLYIQKRCQLYEKDDDTSKVLAVLEYGSYVHKIGDDPYSQKNYSQVEFGSKKGYIKTRAATSKMLFAKKKQTMYALKNTDLYAKADDKSRKVDSIEKDQSITMIAQSKDWLKFQLRANKKIVYARKKYFTLAAPRIVEPLEMMAANPDSASATQQVFSVPSTQGEKIVNFALRFVGNPYRFGGTSLTNGADCSGFTQSVFANFGISISRSSWSQMSDGKAVSVSAMSPGDLVVYPNHVGIYIGEGQIVHAANEWQGITTGSAYYTTILGVRRLG